MSTGLRFDTKPILVEGIQFVEVRSPVIKPRVEGVQTTLDYGLEDLREDVERGLRFNENCGIGSGGFQPGNTCAKGGLTNLPPEQKRILKQLAEGEKSVAYLHKLQPGIISAQSAYHATIMPAEELARAGLIEQTGMAEGITGIGASYAGPGSAPANKVEADDPIRRIYKISDKGREALGLPKLIPVTEEVYDRVVDFQSKQTYLKTVIGKAERELAEAKGKPRLQKQAKEKLKKFQSQFSKLGQDFPDLTHNLTNTVTDALGVVDNVFCPTGKGGGVDPSCSLGGSKTASAAEGASGWTSDEEKAVFKYTLGHDLSYVVSMDLRSPGSGAKTVDQLIAERPKFYNEERAGYLRNLESAVSKGKLEADTTLYRGLDNYMFRDVKRMKIGEELYDSAFTSTSSDRKAASEFKGGARGTGGGLIAIRAKTGTKALSLGKLGASIYKDQSEVLLGRDKKLIYAGKVGNLHTFDLVQNSKPTDNVFCPTGKGGGVDPSCGLGGSKTAGGSAGGFPTSLEGLKTIKGLGGSTGAKLVEDPVTGARYVLKTGPNGNPGHLRSELRANEAYEAAGVLVPKAKIYETDTGPVKLSQFVEGQTLGSLSPGEQLKAYDEIRKGFATDVALCNWDVAGQSKDNILITPDGKAYRVDVGGSLEYRAMGAPKGEAWNEKATEFDSLRNPGINKASGSVFKDISQKQVDESVESLVANKSKILGALPLQQGLIVAARIDNIVLRNSAAKLNEKIKAHNAELEAAKSVVSSAKGKLESGEGVASHLKGNLTESKFKEGHLEKIKFLNPNGIENGTFYMPLMGATKKDPVNAINEAFIQKTLPPGTQIKGVWVSKKSMEGEAGVSKTTKVGDKAPPGFHNPVPSQLTPTPSIKLTSNNTPDIVKTWYHSGPSALTNPELHAVQSWKGSARGMRKATAANPPPPPSGDSEYETDARNFYNGLLKAPKAEGTFHRGISGEWGAKQAALMKAAGVGGTWEEMAPMCMSRNTSTAKNFASGELVLRVRAKTGRPIEAIGGHHGEQEVVGMPGVKYRILQIEENVKLTGNTIKHLIELEEILYD